MQKKAIFLGECMIELNGDISSLGNSNTIMKVNFGGDTYNSAVYFSRLTNKKLSLKLVEVFLQTKFEGGRHLRRVKKI